MSATAADRPATLNESPAGFAGVVSRTVAYVLDALTVSILSAGGAAATNMIASVIGADAHDVAQALTTAFLVGLPAVFALYCTAFWGLTGRTPGMALVGVRVVTTNRNRVGWWRALLRGFLLAYFPIGSLWLLVDRRHMAIHDKIARTLVIRS
ncbi:RDD family protein [Actinoplanes sp. CA-030573]|uniref:RDD family protein n=1 Tax=Actinoplanes sp. CA-030573 TaxID=3239898 RepID=UPI003D8C8B92